jgi:hypothetical protein
MMLARQREGIAKAAAECKYKGRVPTARAKVSQVKALAREGVTRESIAKQLGIGVASVYRAEGRIASGIQPNPRGRSGYSRTCVWGGLLLATYPTMGSRLVRDEADDPARGDRLRRHHQNIGNTS